MTPAGSAMVRGRLGQRWIGAALLVNFAVVVAIKIKLNCAPEVLWMSHVALLLAGVGLIADRTLPVTTALTSVALLHSIWLVDCLIWLTFERFPLGVCNYLSDANGLVWLATAHHFYLVPLLIVLVARRGCWPRITLAMAMVLFLYLTILCRTISPRELNVNYAFGVLTALHAPAVEWANGLDGGVYLLLLNAIVAAGFFAPVHLAGRRWIEPGRRAQKNARRRWRATGTDVLKGRIRQPVSASRGGACD